VIKLWEKNFEPFFCNTDSLNTHVVNILVVNPFVSVQHALLLLANSRLFRQKNPYIRTLQMAQKSRPEAKIIFQSSKV
jgi:hypothetical protein